MARLTKEKYKELNNLPMYYLERRNEQLELADEMVNQIYWYDCVVNKLADKNKKLEQALNEIEEYIKSESPDAGVSGHRILQIINKYKKED